MKNMSCSIINRTTQTTIGRNGEVVEKSNKSGSALQNPDISRMTLNALMRNQMRVKQGTARSFWSHFMTRNASANTNTTETAAV
ncbi:MAG: hypothetical protein KKA05_05275 [Alphaproteobacteria bacterium]|nr:hypothetical protein [Alphaproteobacteria bacterium]